MRKIIDVHHPHLDTKLLDQVLIKFYWLREQSELRKKPSTSELIDWISALLRSGVSMDKLARISHQVSSRERGGACGSRLHRPRRPEAYLNSMSRTTREYGLEPRAHLRSQQKAGEICGLEQHIPFVGALLKKEQDVDALLRYDEKGGIRRAGRIWGRG